jgi:hypothetical protein
VVEGALLNDGALPFAGDGLETLADWVTGLLFVYWLVGSEAVMWVSISINLLHKIT